MTPCVCAVVAYSTLVNQGDMGSFWCTSYLISRVNRRLVLNGTVPYFHPILTLSVPIFLDVSFFIIFALGVRTEVKIKEKNANFVKETLTFHFGLKKGKNSCFLMIMHLNPEAYSFKTCCSLLTP